MGFQFVSIKKYLVDVLVFLFILLFVYAAVSKFIDFEEFQHQLGQSPLLGSYAHIVVWLVPLSELIVALMMIFKSTQRFAIFTFYTMMVMFTVYIVIILNFTSFIPCSCGGVLEELGWTEHLIFNLVFVLLAMVALWMLYNHQHPTISKRKLLLQLLGWAVFGAMAVTFLFIVSEETIKRNNSFLRRYPHHPVQKETVLDISYNSYYIAGITSKHIYLGNTTAPLHVLQLSRDLQDTTHIRLRLEDKESYAFRAVQVRVKGNHFFVTDGTVPVIYRGELSTLTARPVMTTPIFFNRLEVMNDSIFVIRTRSAATNETVLGLLQIGDTSKVELNHHLLERQEHGIFDTDGLLIYNQKLQQVVYTYFYRNEFIVADNNLELIYRGKTIDTVSRAQISIDTLRSRNENRLAAAPLMVNIQTATAGNYFFVQSDRLGRYEPERMLKEASIIDVYHLTKNTYEFSFYIHHQQNEKLRSFHVMDSLLVALQGNLIVTYRLKKEHFK